MRPVLIALLLLIVRSNITHAQDWAQKMFKSTQHDFGTLARGSMPEFVFELTNVYKEEVRIAGVRSSCGCTIPKATKSTLKTNEKGQILCKFNTIAHLGKKSASVTVTFDKPFAAEVQLNVTAVVRRDIVMQPGMVKFGDVLQGNAAAKTINLEYAGRADWEIVDVRSTNEDYEVELAETKRDSNHVAYKLMVRLKETARIGFFNDHLTLVTNDPEARAIALPVEGRVMGSVTVSPTSLALGEVALGGQVSKRILVRGKEPFRIIEVKYNGDCFSISPSPKSSTIHILPVTFVAKGTPGRITEKIRIKTDLGTGACAECIATVTVTTTNR